ncbi:MAG: ABC transporter permease subunit [Phormidesmis sp.]
MSDLSGLNKSTAQPDSPALKDPALKDPALKDSLNQPFGKQSVGSDSWLNRQWAALIWLGLVAWALWLSGWGRSPIVNWGGLPEVGRFWLAMFHPTLTVEFLQVMLSAAGVTLAFAVCGTACSLALGLVFGVASSQVWWQVFLPGRAGWLLWTGVRTVLSVPRAIHEWIWGLLLLSVLGLDPLVGILAIALPFGAITAKVFSEILDETPTAPLEALVNSGVRPGRAFLYGHLPQALPNLISYGFYRFECSLRAAAVLGVIGAGGLGYQIFLSAQSLRYEELWTGFYALIFLNGLVDSWSGWLRKRMGFVGRMALAKASTAPRRQGSDLRLEQERDQSADSRSVFSQRQQRIPLWPSWGAIAFAFPACLAYLNIDWSRLLRLRSLFTDIAVQVTPDKVLPNFSFDLLPIALQTVAMSVLAITLASLGGILFSFPAAQNFFLPGGILRAEGERGKGKRGKGNASYLGLWISRLILLTARAIPAPILAFVILLGMLPGMWPGVLALALHNFGILGRLMAEVNENLPEQPVRGLRSLGASAGGVVFYGILPANLARFLAYSLYRWEVCLRETVIVGLVGVGGLGRIMTEQLSGFDYSGLAATLTVFIMLTVMVDFISSGLRAAFR